MSQVDEDTRRSIAALDYKAHSAEAGDRIKHQVSFVESGLRTLTLINGGALVALFTLIGGNAHVTVSSRLLWAAFGFFAAGLVFTMLANLGAFFSQGMYADVTIRQAWDAQRIMHGLPAREDVDTPFQRGRNAEFGGIAAAILALLSFVCGCALAFAGVIPG